MKATDSLRVHGRGALLGLAFFFCTHDQTIASELGDTVHRLFRHQSYILVETPTEPARLLLLSSESKSDPLSVEDTVLRQVLVDLGDIDPDGREDAVLALADIDAEGAFDILASALSDSSPQVRDTAAAVIEEISDSEATGFGDHNRLRSETSMD
jgi:HEAT repeat protein